MFGFEYLVGLLEVLVKIGYSIVWAIPINFVWSKLGIVYFDYLDDKWLNMPYWHIVGFCLLVDFIGKNISTLTPTLMKVDNSNKEK